MKNLQLNHDEAAFLLVLLCEEPTIEKRMAEVGHSLKNVNLHDMSERVRKICWQFHWDEQAKKKG